MSRRLMVATQILVPTNTFPKAKVASIATENGKIKEEKKERKKRKEKKSPPAPQKRGLRVYRCHMNPGSAFPAALTQLLSADGTPARCVEVGLLCGGERSAFTVRSHWHGKAGHKIWSGIQSHPPQWGWGG